MPAPDVGALDPAAEARRLAVEIGELNVRIETLTRQGRLAEAAILRDQARQLSVRAAVLRGQAASQEGILAGEAGQPSLFERLGNAVKAAGMGVALLAAAVVAFVLLRRKAA